MAIRRKNPEGITPGERKSRKSCIGRGLSERATVNNKLETLCSQACCAFGGLSAGAFLPFVGAEAAYWPPRSVSNAGPLAHKRTSTRLSETGRSCQALTGNPLRPRSEESGRPSIDTLTQHELVPVESVFSLGSRFRQLEAGADGYCCGCQVSWVSPNQSRLDSPLAPSPARSLSTSDVALMPVALNTQHLAVLRNCLSAF